MIAHIEKSDIIIDRINLNYKLGICKRCFFIPLARRRRKLFLRKKLLDIVDWRKTYEI